MPKKGVWIVQSDLTILLDKTAASAVEARKALQTFAEMIKVMGQYERYQMTAITVWNALTLGIRPDNIMGIVQQYCKGSIPLLAEQTLHQWMSRYGRLSLKFDQHRLLLYGDKDIFNEIMALQSIAPLLGAHIGLALEVKIENRGILKQELTRHGYAISDEVGYRDGEQMSIELNAKNKNGDLFQLRDYQRKAIAAFHRDRLGGSGIIVLPCGTGKTVTGIGVMASLKSATLILTSSVTSAQQWKKELLDKTSLVAEQIAIYGGKERSVAQITIATYTILTHRSRKANEYEHMRLFSERDWGLIIYDEVQLLPAPMFRMTANIQATRRLGLTATLIREDGCAEDVYSLVGPKLYDMQWKKAEEQSYIAKVHCTEVRVALSATSTAAYESLGARARLRLAAENKNKLSVVNKILDLHKNQPTLIIGQYIDQLRIIASALNTPLLTGETSHQERFELFEQFNNGSVTVLVVSKIANLAVDLPDATVAIQVSGSFGSRQEEAQRIGRLLRPKKNRNEAWFYTLVSEYTKETEFALKRGLFMLEQGYQYRCISESEVTTI